MIDNQDSISSENKQKQENSSPVPATTNENALIVNRLSVHFKKSDKGRTKIIYIKPLKQARLYDAKGDISKEWFFEFYVPDEDGKPRRVKERFDINRIKGRSEADTVKKRRAYAKEILPQIDKWMADGAIGQLDPSDVKYNVREAMEMIVKVKNKETDKKRSRQTYKSIVNLFVEWCQLKALSTIPVNDFTHHHFQQYIDYLLQDKNLSRRTVNNHAAYLQNFFKVMIKREWIKVNPADKFEKMTVTKYVKNIPFTTNELKKIMEQLPKKHPRLFLLMSFIWYAYARRSEIALIKRGDIDFNYKLLHLHGSITKNRNSNTVTIVDEFIEILKEFEVDKLSDNEYIFSKRITLEPGLQAIEPNRISECWKDIVKDGIGIQKDLYASKHTSGMLFILNGGSKEALQYQMRHSSVAETENYIKTIVPTDMSRKFAEQFSFGLKFK